MGTVSICRFCSGIFLLACIGFVHAQPFPAQPLRLVVPWAPGLDDRLPESDAR
jgi:tripartite-type tricarboxylate transporter receptor subunit TctC